MLIPTDKKRTCAKLLLAGLAALPLTLPAASKTPMDHGQQGSDPMAGMHQGMTMDDMDMSHMKALPAAASDAPMMQGMHGHHGGHAHASWPAPPAGYQDRTYDQWNSYERANRGMALYRDNCVACHGIDGRGTGPLAKSLKHPPADLTNHFHQSAGQGDQYLFWRMSEGGTAQPFAGMDSAMPAFQQQLSETQRWDVLTYVHQAFHRGFKAEQNLSLQTPPVDGHADAHH